MKSKTISLRLSKEEQSILDRLCSEANVSQSEYIRSVIRSRDSQIRLDCEQTIIDILSRIYILLAEMGLEEDTVTKEVMQLCQIL